MREWFASVARGRIWDEAPDNAKYFEDGLIKVVDKSDYQQLRDECEKLATALEFYSMGAHNPCGTVVETGAHAKKSLAAFRSRYPKEGR